MAWMSLFVPGGLARMRARAVESFAPSPRYLAANVACSFLAAIIGGWVTVRIAAASPNAHLLALGGLVLVLGAISGAGAQSRGQPRWYRLTIPLVGAAGVLASSLV